jgi:hypothetical protein
MCIASEEALSSALANESSHLSYHLDFKGFLFVFIQK